MSNSEYKSLLTKLQEADTSNPHLPPTISPESALDMPATTVEEVGVAVSEVQETARNSLDFLAALVMPTIFKFGYPPVFQAVWQWLTSQADVARAFYQLALGLPRGFGKTTLVKLFLIYCILFTEKKFILIISASAKLAEAEIMRINFFSVNRIQRRSLFS